MSSRRELQGYLWTCYQFKLDARLGLLNTKFICSHFSISILTPFNKKRSRNLYLWIIFRVNNWKVETIASEIIAPIWQFPHWTLYPLRILSKHFVDIPRIGFRLSNEKHGNLLFTTRRDECDFYYRMYGV